MRNTICFSLIIVSVMFVVSCGKRFRETGHSMFPTVGKGDVYLVDEHAFESQTPARGDLIVYKSPILKQLLVRRVVGLPGEKVAIAPDGSVLINGQNLPELAKFRYRKYPRDKHTIRVDFPYVVQPNSYFVLADNPNQAWNDSRATGGVAISAIIGKVTNYK